MAALVGLATGRIELGTAVVPVQPRHPVALAQQALSVQAVCEGRLALGLGVSHHWVVDGMLGLPYERPAATMRAHLDVLDQALRAWFTNAVRYRTFHGDVHAGNLMLCADGRLAVLDWGITGRLRPAAHAALVAGRWER